MIFNLILYIPVPSYKIGSLVRSSHPTNSSLDTVSMESDANDSWEPLSYLTPASFLAFFFGTGGGTFLERLRGVTSLSSWSYGYGRSEILPGYNFCLREEGGLPFLKSVYPHKNALFEFTNYSIFFITAVFQINLCI